jgi:hypothetical protein
VPRRLEPAAPRLHRPQCRPMPCTAWRRASSRMSRPASATQRQRVGSVRGRDAHEAAARSRARALATYPSGRPAPLVAAIRATRSPREDAASKATVWPPYTTAFVIDLASIRELEPSLASVAAVLAHFPLPGDAVTLIPARDSNGAQIPGGKVHPALVVADEWAGLVPVAHKTPLADPSSGRTSPSGALGACVPRPLPRGSRALAARLSATAVAPPAVLRGGDRAIGATCARSRSRTAS